MDLPHDPTRNDVVAGPAAHQHSDSGHEVLHELLAGNGEHVEELADGCFEAVQDGQLYCRTERL